MLLLLACAGPAQKPPADTGEPSSPAYTFAGTAAFRYEVDGVVVCDAEASLAGAPAADPCPDCEFALDITPTVTRDDSTSACTDGSPFGPAFLELAFAARFETYVFDDPCYDDDCGGSDRIYTDALLGTSRWGGALEVVAHHDPPTTDVTWDGEALTWSYASETTRTEETHTFFHVCDGPNANEAEAPAVGTVEAGTLARNTVDVWDVDLVAGEQIVATVEPAGGDLFAYLALNTPDGCTRVYGGLVDCPSTAEVDYRCSTVGYTATTTGTHQLGIEALNTGGPYTLTVQGGTGVATAAEDLPLLHDVTYTIAASGSGALTTVE